MKPIQYIYLFLLCIKISYAQTYVYHHFGVDEGLPSSEVYDIHQDKQGYVWFATDKGLSRYNGYEFENYTTKDGLPDNTILKFFPQKNGQVWCYGYNNKSLFYFNDNAFNGFNNYKYNHLIKENIGNSVVIKNIVLDDNGTLYIGSYHSNGLIKISKSGTFEHLYNNSTNSANAKRTLIILPKQKVFFYANSDTPLSKEAHRIPVSESAKFRMELLFLSNEHIVFIDSDIGVRSSNGAIRRYKTKNPPIAVAKISDSLFFTGYYNGGAEIRTIDGTLTNHFLPQNSVSCAILDKEGGYWLSTIDDGVYYIKKPNIKIKTNSHIGSLAKDHNNRLFAGYNNGSIKQLNTKNTIELEPSIKRGKALVAFNQKTKHLYGFTNSKLTNYNTQRSYSLYANKLPEVINDPLLGSSASCYYEATTNNFKIHRLEHNIQDVCYFRDTIFIGTSAGLYIKQGSKHEKHQPNPLLKSRIDDIDVNPNTNTMYMATQGNGVIVYKDSIYNISKKEGLTNAIVSEVYIENDSTIWACTNTGLNKIDFHKQNNYTITTLTKSDGLISNDINTIEITNDTVWVATKKGLCYFKKKTLKEHKKQRILSFNLRKVEANNTLVHTPNTTIKHKQPISFNLQAISLKNTEKIRYWYRLKELDTTWISTSNRTIAFSSLPHGNYTFEAKASVQEAESNNTIHYTFKVLPPFWNSWWFYSLCLLLVAIIIYLFFKVRILTYNKDVFRELIRLAIKRIKQEEPIYTFRSNGEDFKIATRHIQYIQSQGNYLDIYTTQRTFTIRCKIGDFIESTPDPLEYLRVHRSYIIRIDQVTSKGKNWVVIKDTKIPVGQTYLKVLDRIVF